MEGEEAIKSAFRCASLSFFGRIQRSNNDEQNALRGCEKILPTTLNTERKKNPEIESRLALRRWKRNSNDLILRTIN